MSLIPAHVGPPRNAVHAIRRGQPGRLPVTCRARRVTAVPSNSAGTLEAYIDTIAEIRQPENSD